MQVKQERLGKKKAGFIAMIHGGGFNGTVATTSAEGMSMTNDRFAAGLLCGVTSHNSCVRVLVATSCVDPGSDRHCFIGRMMRETTSFRVRVFAVVRSIPSGATLTYGEVARRAGNPKAARAVGAILGKNFDPVIPCHRVVRSDGTLGGYNRGVEKKEELLRSEFASRYIEGK